MIGDDAMAGRLGTARAHIGQVGDGAGQGAKQIGLVIGGDALQQRRDALQPHAGVDRRARQRDALAGRDLLILHEDEIPELQKAVAVLLRAAGRSARERVALVVEDLRAGTAGAKVAHAPEIVGIVDADDARIGKAGDFLPQVEGRVVVVIDGDEQAVDRQLEFAGDQIPREFDGVFLEIIAEGKIAEHLEKSVMPRGVADIVEIIVLAAGAHAFLRGGRARAATLFDAGEGVLELHHARVGEHQRRIIVRDERRRRDELMIVAREIIEKSRTDLIDAAHGLVGSLSLLTLVSSRSRFGRRRRARRPSLFPCDMPVRRGLGNGKGRSSRRRRPIRRGRGRGPGDNIDGR